VRYALVNGGVLAYSFCIAVRVFSSPKSSSAASKSNMPSSSSKSKSESEKSSYSSSSESESKEAPPRRGVMRDSKGDGGSEDESTTW